MPYTRHSKDVIFSVLRTLKANDFNFLKTEEETKVVRKTIKRWRKKFGTAVYEQNLPEKIIDETEPIDDKEENIRKEIVIVQEEILRQIRSIIPLNNNAKQLAEAMKILNDINDSLANPRAPADKTDNRKYFSTIIEQFNNMNIKTNDIQKK